MSDKKAVVSLRTVAERVGLAPCSVSAVLNRTPASYLAAKIAAEYLLHWLPVGTHDWGKFIKPVELGAMLRRLGLRVTDLAGLSPELLTGRWRVARVTSVNYILAATI